jgi:hypothetical protein
LIAGGPGCGNLEVDQAWRPKDLERENARLKWAVADMPDLATRFRAVVVSLAALRRLDEAREAARQYEEADPAGTRVFADRIVQMSANKSLVSVMQRGLCIAALPK